ITATVSPFGLAVAPTKPERLLRGREQVVQLLLEAFLHHPLDPGVNTAGVLLRDAVRTAIISRKRADQSRLDPLEEDIGVGEPEIGEVRRDGRRFRPVSDTERVRRVQDRAWRLRAADLRPRRDEGAYLGPQPVAQAHIRQPTALRQRTRILAAKRTQQVP